MERKYIAFISYRHAELDSAAAKKLHGLIEQYTIPKALRRDGRKKLGLVFRDREELPVASDLAEEIRSALDNSRYLILVCSPRTPASPWVEREIEYFLLHHPRQNILPLLIEGEPDRAFPTALTRLSDAESGDKQSVEPLAVDVRADSSGGVLRRMRRELSRLLAVMIGCPYDALVLREQKRQRRRISALAAAVTAVALCFSSVLMIKNSQIDEKNAQLLEINQSLDEKNEELELVNLELESSNESLDRQRQEALLRESQLLTADARAALEKGDNFTAILNAVSALPRSGLERPYYAPAESVLMEALHIFSPDLTQAVVSSTRFSQLTPITDYSVSSDGKLLLTLDEYGLVSCYDSASTQLLWKNSVFPEGRISYYGKIMPAENFGKLLCAVNNRLVCFDLESGEALWNYSSEGNLYVEDRQFFLSPDQSSLAMVINHCVYGGECSYLLAVVSVETGQQLQLTELLTTDYDDNFNYDFQNSNTVDSIVFSDDGKLLAGAYTHLAEQSDTYCRYFYCVELDSGSLRTVHRAELGSNSYGQDIVSMAFSGDGTKLYIVSELDSTGCAAAVDCVDLARGELLWSARTPEESGTQVLSGKVHAVISDSRIVVGHTERMYAFSPADGELQAQVSLIDELQAMFPLDDYFFSFVLKNGYHAVGWRNSSGLHDSKALGLWLELGACQQSKILHGGILRPVVENSTIVDFVIDSLGCAAVIPTDDNCSVILKQAMLISQALPTRNLITVPYAYYSAPEIIRLGESLALGPMDIWNEQLQKYEKHFFLQDSSRNCTDILLPALPYSSSVLFLPDASGFISSNGKGDVALWDLNSELVSQLSSSD